MYFCHINTLNFQKMKGKIVFITGASSGIGEGCARKFASEGSDLILNARNTAKLESLKAEFEEKYGSRVLLLPFDVRDRKAAENALASLPEEWVKAQMGLTGLRTWLELHGVPSISFGEDPEPKKQICVSRSFAHEITDKEELYEQLSQFVSMAAEKLRKQGSVASEMDIFLLTNRFKDTDRLYSRNRLERLEPPTSDTFAILKVARYAFEQIYDSRVRFKKAGVTFSGIIPSEGMQMSLFDGGETRDNGKLMSVIDSINRKEGAGSVVFASQGFGGVKMNRGHLSPQYTTKFDDILKIKV